MCRAIWAVAIGPDEESCGRIRRAAGADVQVIAMATTLARTQEIIGESEVDVAIVDATTADAYGIVTYLRRSRPKVSVVWIGQEPPETVHASIGREEAEGDGLPSAITRALIARKN